MVNCAQYHNIKHTLQNCTVFAFTGNAKLRSIFPVDFDQGAGVEFVECGDFSGFGHGVPLVLQAARIEGNREIGVGHLATP